MDTMNLAEAEGLPTIEWSQVETQLTHLLTHDDPRSPNRSTFWLTMLNADGSPHVTSVGALWHAGSLWFQTGEHTRKAKNVARDPRCTISVATRGFDVMVAGEARRVTDPKVVAEIAALWATGGWPAEPDDSGSGITAPFNAPTLGPPPWFVYELKPRTATAVGTAEETPVQCSGGSKRGGGTWSALQLQPVVNARPLHAEGLPIRSSDQPYS
jgi:pyridoxamine 5'-phosphate oxidase-like protein